MQQVDTMALDVEVDGRRLTGIIDTGATLSVISSKFVIRRDINQSDVIPIKVGNGEVVFSLGTSTIQVDMAGSVIDQKLLILDTSAFEFVLGMDFLHNSKLMKSCSMPPGWR